MSPSLARSGHSALCQESPVGAGHHAMMGLCAEIDQEVPLESVQRSLRYGERLKEAELTGCSLPVA